MCTEEELGTTIACRVCHKEFGFVRDDPGQKIYECSVCGTLVHQKCLVQGADGSCPPLCAACWTEERDKESEDEGQTFEYLVDYIRTDSADMDYQDMLNEHGARGWTLVEYIPSRNFFVFTRSKR